MSDRSMPTSTNPLSKPQLPPFVEMLDASHKNLIKGLWNVDELTVSDKIDNIDAISDKMSLEARREYRKWRFLMSRSRMPDFYDSQNEEIKTIIAGIFKESTDLEEFAQRINSMKSALNNPDALDKWMKNEEIEFKEPLIQKDMKEESTSQSKGNPLPLISTSMDKLGQEFDSSLKVTGNKTLFYLPYKNNGSWEGRIGLFDSQKYSVEEIAKFNQNYDTFQVATTRNKIFGIDGYKSFEIYDLNTGKISRGPDSPKWRHYASVAYFKDKLYYLGGWFSNRVDVLIDGQWQTGPTFPRPINSVRTITCDGILYVIDRWDSRKIYRLSDDEREWTEIGEIPEIGIYFGAASLNGRIYITGGRSLNDDVLKSCLCFDPSAPVDSRISRIADMNHARHLHSLIVANGKLFAIGGTTKSNDKWILCSEIEEYDPQMNKWQEVGTLKLE